MSDAVLGYAEREFFTNARNENVARVGGLHCNLSPAEEVLVGELGSTCPTEEDVVLMNKL